MRVICTLVWHRPTEKRSTCPGNTVDIKKKIIYYSLRISFGISNNIKWVNLVINTWICKWIQLMLMWSCELGDYSRVNRMNRKWFITPLSARQVRNGATNSPSPSRRYRDWGSLLWWNHDMGKFSTSVVHFSGIRWSLVNALHKTSEISSFDVSSLLAVFRMILDILPRDGTWRLPSHHWSRGIKFHHYENGRRQNIVITPVLPLAQYKINAQIRIFSEYTNMCHIGQLQMHK